MVLKRKLATGAIALMTAIVPAAALAANFKDVSPSYWGYNAINWAADNNVVVGYPDGTFKPDNNVTEAEFLTMLLRAYHPQLPQVEVHHWADQFYAFSKAMNYPLSGYDNISARDWVITRQHVAEIVAGAAGVNYTGRDAIHFLLAKGLAKGEDPNNITIENFHGEKPLGRAEAVQFVKNLLDSGLKELKPRPQQPSDPSLLPPLPGQPSPQPQPQPPVQPPAPLDSWTPGDSTVLGKAFFSSLKINGDGTVTVRIPTLAELGFEQGKAYVGADYLPVTGSGEMARDLVPGNTYTLKMGPGATVAISLLTPASASGTESYALRLDGSWQVFTANLVNGKTAGKRASLDAVMKGLGLK